MGTLIDFWNPNCKPCMDMMGIVEHIEAEGKVEVIKVNTDIKPELAMDYDVMCLPTFIFIQDGVEVARHEGTASKEKFDTIIAGM